MRAKTRIESALSLLTEDGNLAGGKLIPVDRLEEIFEFKEGTQEFNWLIAGVRTALYEKGLYLSGEGVSQTNGYEILPPAENFYIAKLAMAKAERNLVGKQTLLINTDLEGLTDLQKARHESTLRLLSLRLSAMRKVAAANERTALRRKAILDQEETPEENHNVSQRS